MRSKSKALTHEAAAENLHITKGELKAKGDRAAELGCPLFSSVISKFGFALLDDHRKCNEALFIFFSF